MKSAKSKDQNKSRRFQVCERKIIDTLINKVKYCNQHTKPSSDLHVGETVTILKDDHWKRAVSSNINEVIKEISSLFIFL